MKEFIDVTNHKDFMSINRNNRGNITLYTTYYTGTRDYHSVFVSLTDHDAIRLIAQLSQLLIHNTKVDNPNKV